MSKRLPGKEEEGIIIYTAKMKLLRDPLQEKFLLICVLVFLERLKIHR